MTRIIVILITLCLLGCAAHQITTQRPCTDEELKKATDIIQGSSPEQEQDERFWRAFIAAGLLHDCK